MIVGQALETFLNRELLINVKSIFCFCIKCLDKNSVDRGGWHSGKSIFIWNNWNFITYKNSQRNVLIAFIISIIEILNIKSDYITI